MPWYDGLQRRPCSHAPAAGGLVRLLIRNAIGERRGRFRGPRWAVRPGDNATDHGLWLGRVEETAELAPSAPVSTRRPTSR